MVARNVNNRCDACSQTSLATTIFILREPPRLGFALYNKNINSHLYTYAVHRYLLFCSNNLSSRRSQVGACSSINVKTCDSQSGKNGYYTIIYSTTIFTGVAYKWYLQWKKKKRLNMTRILTRSRSFILFLSLSLSVVIFPYHCLENVTLFNAKQRYVHAPLCRLK